LEQPLSPHPRQGRGEDKAQILSADSLATILRTQALGKLLDKKKKTIKERKTEVRPNKGGRENRAYLPWSSGVSREEK